MSTAECRKCGKTFPDTGADINAHIKEHYEIEMLAGRSGYPFTTTFPIQIHSVDGNVGYWIYSTYTPDKALGEQ